MNILEKIFGKAEKKQQEELFQITVTSDSVSVGYPKEKTKTIKWKDIQEVRVVNGDEDALAPDVWLELVGKDDRCLIPKGADGYNEVFEIVSGYDGFDAMNYIKAMSAAGNEKAVLWKRES